MYPQLIEKEKKELNINYVFGSASENIVGQE